MEGRGRGLAWGYVNITWCVYWVCKDYTGSCGQDIGVVVTLGGLPGEERRVDCAP